MYHDDGSFTLSATDLASFLGCRHRTALDMAVATGARKKPFVPADPLLEALAQRGLEHERRHVDSLHDVVDLSAGSISERRSRTRQAMRDGSNVIFQGALGDGPWMGYPDILQRIDTPSALGTWSYEVADTKLSLETRAGTILQLSLYSEMLAAAQDRRPERFHVITPDPVSPRKTFRVDDYAAYFRFVRASLLATVAQDWEQVADGHYPEPVDQCTVCKWQQTCTGKRRADDHLSLVAGITRMQRRELEARSVSTLTSLARMAMPIAFTPRRGSRESFARVREQARLQADSRDRVPPLFELLDVEKDRGLCRLPEPSPGDLFLDLEGDPLAAEGGREYLFGLVASDGSYRARWAFTGHDERLAFEWVMDEIAAAMAAHPDMHVYHYAPYEPAAFKRLMGSHATRERELDAMLRAGRFVDLYGVVRQGLRAGIERYSIKNLEPLYGFTRDVALADANRMLRVMELALMTNAANDVPAEVRAVVQGYNRDDCISTLRLRDWLEALRARRVADGAEIPRPVPGDDATPEKVDEKAQTRGRIARAAAGRRAPGTAWSATPNSRVDGCWRTCSTIIAAKRRRRGGSTSVSASCPRRSCSTSAKPWQAWRSVVEHVGTGGSDGSVIDRYTYPLQEMEIDPGDEVRLQDGKPFGKVVAGESRRLHHRREEGTVAGGTASDGDVQRSRTYRPKPWKGRLLRIGERCRRLEGFARRRARVRCWRRDRRCWSPNRSRRAPANRRWTSRFAPD